MVHILTKNNQIKIIDFPRAVKLYFKRFGLHESPFAFPFDQLLHVPEHPMQTNPSKQKIYLRLTPPASRKASTEQLKAYF